MSAALASAWQKQIDFCDRNGSPFTARVLEAAWTDWLDGGALRALMPDWPRDPGADAVPLRVAGALHSLVLDGSDPALAAIYPEHADRFDPVAGPAAIRNAIAAHRARIAAYLRRPPQTNEIGRSAILLGGFATIAIRTGLALALREIGASAGLNLLWHRYRYDLGAGRTWGNADNPVTIRSDWRGTPPALPPTMRIASWHGCDEAPIDLVDPDAALRLTSYVWPDQSERLARLRAAIALARTAELQVERVDAAAFVQRELARPRRGETTVVYHSIVWQYLAPATREAIRTAIQDAGTRTTAAAPLAWLALEPPAAARPRLTLTLWPGGEPETLADAHPHGMDADWGAAAA